MSAWIRFVPLLSLCAPVVAGAQVFPGAQGQAVTLPANGGAVRTSVTLQDTGSSLVATGTGTGFVPGRVYVTIVYDTKATHAGRRACTPTNRTIPWNAMVVGAWALDSAGNGVLSIAKTGPFYVPLYQIGAVSVSEDTNVGQPLPPDFDPVRFQSRSCGKFRAQ